MLYLYPGVLLLRPVHLQQFVYFPLPVLSSISREEKRDIRRTILCYAVAVRELCLEYKRAVPTVIKLIYDAKTRQVRAQYGYERLKPLSEYADETRCRMWFDEIRANNL